MRPQLPDGVEAVVTHLRKTTCGHYATPEAIREFRLKAEPKGGATFVELYNSEGRFLGIGMAACRTDDDRGPGDNFNKSLGRNIALGRAMKVAGL